MLEKSCLKLLTGDKKAARAIEAGKSSLYDSPRREGLTKLQALDQSLLRSFTQLSALASLVW